MSYKPQKQYRYKGYDYSQDGFYFVTICVKNREMFFGDVVVGKMRLSEIGKIAKKFWLEIPDHFPFVKLDEYAIMPNHVHVIIAIDNRRNAPRRVLSCRVPVNNAPTVEMNTPQQNALRQNAPAIGMNAPQQNAPTIEMNTPCRVPAVNNVNAFGQNAPRRVPTGIQPLVKNSLSSVINHFKGNTKRFCNKNNLEYFAWQARFHDRIIRNDDELNRIRQYIMDNPEKWELDRNNQENLYM